MARIYYPSELNSGAEIRIQQRKQIHYACDVLRLRAGQEIFVFNGKGKEYICRIKELSKRGMSLIVKQEIKNKGPHATNLTIACALPKQAARFDDLVDKLSQLGVDRIIPLVTERVVVRWNPLQRQRHHRRWCKIAEQACIQSGRNTLPVIDQIKQLNQLLSSSELGRQGLRLIATLGGNKRDLGDIISGIMPKSILVLIGPEGDFSDREAGQAEASGFTPVSLGDLVLRVDTAAIAVSAFLRLRKSTESTPIKDNSINP